MTLLYDSAEVYDSPDYTYDGVAVAFVALTIKDALYRELKYSGVLDGLVEHLRLDERPDVPSLRDVYPFLVFRRVTTAEDNQVRYATERWEIEVIGRASDADALEAIAEAVTDHFAGKRRTWGAFTDEGNASPLTGLRMKALHLDTVEFSDRQTGEAAIIILFLFSYVREVSV